MIIDDFTGHEHLLDFGLINMNGRMYDPLLSSFLSPDNYMQDPTSQQGFNRYAYCMYNPLKYVDPSGERQMGWVYSTYQWEQEARAIALKEQYKVYEVIIKQHNDIIDWMTNSIYTQGNNACGGGGSSGNHGSGGGDGGNSGGQTENGHGGKDNTQNNSSKSILDGLPGSSKDNPASAKDLAEKIYWWYMFGNRQNFYVDASTIDFSYLSYGDLKDKGDGTYSINLFSDPYLNIDPDMASILGEFSLTSKGNNFYQIDNDTYDFDIHFNKGFSKRNIITVLGGFILYGNINNRHYIPTPAMFLGGPFQIHFVNCVYIKP